jgi:hypothetical protein
LRQSGKLHIFRSVTWKFRADQFTPMRKLLWAG